MKRASQIINDIQNNKADSLFLDIYQDESMIEFQKKIDIIYFAYLYDIGNSKPRTEIDDLNKVKVFSFTNILHISFEILTTLI